MAKENKKPIGAGWWLKLLVLAMAALLVLDSIQILNMSAVVTRVDKYNQGVVDEMGGFRGNVESFGNDLNEIRKFLLLPEKDYSSGGAEVAETNAGETPASENQLGLYAFLDQYTADNKLEQNQQTGQKAWDALIKNADFLAKLQTMNLSLQILPAAPMQAKLIDRMEKNADGSANELLGQPIFGLVFDGQENHFTIQSALGNENIANYGTDSFPAQVSDYFSKNLASARAMKIDQKKAADVQATEAVKTTQAAVQAQKDDFEKTIHDLAFTDSLGAIGLKVAATGREENNKLIYDVTDQQGQLKFSFAMEISSGMVKVIEGNQELDVKDFLNSDGSKKKP